METNEKTFKAWFKRQLPLILAFTIPLVAMLLVFIQRGIFPFGDRSFLRTDLYHQYAPFFRELKDKFLNGESLLYSWDIGAGTNFVALMAYYLASPLNWFLFLCPVEFVIEFISYMIVLKIALCGLSFAWYLRKHTRTNSLGIAFFATFYALSGYMAAYSWNIMWLDCLILFPIIILGLERLVYEDKCLMYCISLSLCVLSNYYISIMVCLTLIIYFLALLFIAPMRREEIERVDSHRLVKRSIFMNYPKKIFEFAFYSFLAAGISMIVLLPEMKALQMSASADSTFPKTFSSYFTMLEMLARHLVDVEVHIGLDHWPNLYCGVGILIFIPLYIMNRKVNYREKFAYATLVLIFLASFSMNFLNFIWHGFHYPNSLPCRQSFAYDFIVLVACYKGYMGLKDRSIKEIARAILVALGLILLFEQVTKGNTLFHFHVFYVSAIFVGFYGLFAYLYRKKISSTAYKRGLAIAACFMVLIEGFLNTTVTSVTTINRPAYVEQNGDFAALYDAAKTHTDQLAYSEYYRPEFGNVDTITNLFRLERFDLRTKNDGSWFQYPSISVFSSVANANLTAFYKKLGMESNTNAYSSTGATALIDAIFNVRYKFNNEEIPNNIVTTNFASSNKLYLLENNNVLSIGFFVEGTAEEFSDRWNANSNAITTQNNFVKNIAGIDRAVLEVIAADKTEDKTLTFTAQKDGYYHFYTLNSTIDDIDVRVEGKASKRSGSLKRRYIINVGYVQAGKTITISTPNDGKISGSLYYFNGDVLAKAVDALKPGCLAVTDFDDTHVNGYVTAKSNGILFTTIPYEKGWTARVDGAIVDTEKAVDTFLAIPLTEGTHKIELTYMPDGLKPGLWITLGSILFLICITMLRSIFKQKFGYRFNVFVEEEEIDLRDLEREIEASEKEAEKDETPAEKAEPEPVKETEEKPEPEPEESPKGKPEPEPVKEPDREPEPEAEKADEEPLPSGGPITDDDEADTAEKGDETTDKPETSEANDNKAEKAESEEADKTKPQNNSQPNNNGNRKHFGKKKRNKLR
ncbi:MAG: YfhO family protein [Lachnospiraceae bacterium]|nr:YfhO family protein [Lachnospiraceae bacterium]